MGRIVASGVEAGVIAWFYLVMSLASATDPRRRLQPLSREHSEPSSEEF